MYNEETGKPEDLVPEHIAIRRSMVYSKDRHDKVCRAEVEAPLLIDQLYNHEIIGADHHFYGAQFITMRKLFLAPVGYKVGMMLVKRVGDDEPAPDKPIPMEDTDYTRTMRLVKNPANQKLLRDICDEDADPSLYPFYGRQTHTVTAAFDALSPPTPAHQTGGWSLMNWTIAAGSSVRRM
ncbi:hypothetical protein [Limnoglobus roseus]|uniref:hypothetical protein n=1 Tax=Limnoglobus roseus TaxID=2598579 RepID=UPI001FE74580|nr:hypothetical protein [Limnoglobus roseus]